MRNYLTLLNYFIFNLHAHKTYLFNIGTKPISESSKSALEIRSGEQSKGGPSPFDEYEYKDQAVVAQNIGFNQPNRLNKSYDKHAEDCFDIVDNRNKQNLEIFKGDIKNLAQSADKIHKGSYRYKDPAYIFVKEIDETITAAIVNATDEEYITSINPSSGQMEI